MIISDLNYLECLSKEASDVSGGSTQAKSTSTSASSSESPNHFATSSVNSLSLTSNEPLAITKAENIIKTGGITLTGII